MSFLNDFSNQVVNEKVVLNKESAFLLLSCIKTLALTDSQNEIRHIINTHSLSEILIQAYTDNYKNYSEAQNHFFSILELSSQSVVDLLLEEVFIKDTNIKSFIKSDILHALAERAYINDSPKLFQAYFKYAPQEFEKVADENPNSDREFNLKYELSSRKIMRQINEHACINILNFVLKSAKFKEDLIKKESEMFKDDMLYHTTFATQRLTRYKNKLEGKVEASLECALLIKDNFPQFEKQLAKSVLSGLSSLNQYHDISTHYAQHSYKEHTDFYDTLIISGLLDVDGKIKSEHKWNETTVKEYLAIPEEKLVLFEKEKLERKLSPQNKKSKVLKL